MSYRNFPEKKIHLEPVQNTLYFNQQSFILTGTYSSHLFMVRTFMMISLIFYSATT